MGKKISGGRNSIGNVKTRGINRSVGDGVALLYLIVRVSTVYLLHISDQSCLPFPHPILKNKSTPRMFTFRDNKLRCGWGGVEGEEGEGVEWASINTRSPP